MENTKPNAHFPLVKVNHPAPGDTIRNPTHVAGYGTGFEGVVVVRVNDEAGNELAREGILSSGGMGTVGEFYGDVELSRMPTSQRGVIEAFSSSGRSEEDTPGLVRVPVIFDARLVQG